MPHPDIPVLTPLNRLPTGEPWRLRLLHNRETHLLLSISRGHGRAIVQGIRRGIAPNTVIFVPAGTLFALSLGAQTQGFALDIPLGADVPLPGGAHHLRICDLLGQRELAALFDAMNREQTSGRDFHGAAARAHATLIAVWLRRMLLNQSPEAVPSADQRLAAAYSDMLARDYRSGAAVQGYAARLGVSPAHLARCCKSAAGMSASAMATACSLHAARCLLQETDYPIGRIAAELGFRSQAYFTRFMQKHTGEPPSRLRGPALLQSA